MKVTFTLIFLLITFSIINAQQNLVPNPSFENVESCPQFLGEFTLTDWVNPTWGSPDNFHTCSTGQVGVPQNVVGWQYPKTGNGYIGTWGHSFIGTNYREYIQCQLLFPLEEGEQYEVSFWVSLSDSSTIACNNIGALLSLTPVFLDGNTNLPYTPQVVSEDIISDAVNWIQIIDTITSVGEEEYLTIGVFTDDANTNWIPVSGGWMSEFYYYYDDVSIIKITTTGLNEASKESNISVFPNPSDGYITISSIETINSFEVCSSLGQIIDIKQIDVKNEIIHFEIYSPGVYFIKVTTNESTTIKKIIINN